MTGEGVGEIGERGMMAGMKVFQDLGQAPQTDGTSVVNVPLSTWRAC